MLYKIRTKIFCIGACIVLSCIIASHGMAQTRFVIPDTIPNYAGYKYVDECLMAVLRLDQQAISKDTIWQDTVEVDGRTAQRRVAPAAIAHGRSCLLKVNVDTINPNSKESALLARVLLMVERDDDVSRLIHRTFDAVKTEAEWTQAYRSAFDLYSQARPIRIDGLQQLLKIISPYDTPKQAKGRQLGAAIEVATSALTLGDTTLPREVVTDLLKKLATNEIDKNAPGPRWWYGRQVFPLAADVLLDQAMDSLRVSTVAYRQFLESLWYKLTDEPFSGSEEAVGEKAPPISGKYWYRNGWEVDTGGKVHMTSTVTPIESQVVPVPGKVNAIFFLSGGCHSGTAPASNGFTRYAPGGDCWKQAALVKRLKRQFPKLEVIVVSRTFGSFGGGLPITVDEEAGILSNYILGFLQIPAIQTIVETEFIRMPGLDRRRLDIPVSYEEDIRGFGRVDVLLVDESGLIFHNVTLIPWMNRGEVTMQKKLQAVFDRMQK